MFTENDQRFAFVVCSGDAPSCRAQSGDITDVKGGKVSRLLSGYTEANSIHNRTTMNFVLENLNKK
jgi:hypothetical protein